MSEHKEWSRLRDSAAPGNHDTHRSIAGWPILRGEPLNSVEQKLRSGENVRIDLGCGTQTKPGFIGVDRFPLSGVQVIADLGRPPLPFADSCADLVLAFHSLEHVNDLPAVMKEIWRIGKPGAQVCIVAPYYTMSLNLANPYHKQVFNEHTPRFWTHASTSPINPEEWQEPPLGTQWGLSRSDNSDPGFDLRCMRMEFFYFQDYWGLSEKKKRAARRSRLNVCEQIMYHLLVFKPPLAERDSEKTKMVYYLPPQLAERRRAAASVKPGWRRWLGGL